MIQGTEEWFKIRAGKVTASKISDIIDKTDKKGNVKSGYRNYHALKIAEVMTGKPCEGGFVSKDMERGTELESFARTEYELLKDVWVDQIGFVVHPSIERSGASPDGLVGTNGMIEIKCPKTANHIQYILSGSIPSGYQKQMQWQMACTGRKWNDFVSYDPIMPENQRLYVCRLGRDDEYIEMLEQKVRLFLNDVDETIEKLRRMK